MSGNFRSGFAMHLEDVVPGVINFQLCFKVVVVSWLLSHICYIFKNHQLNLLKKHHQAVPPLSPVGHHLVVTVKIPSDLALLAQPLCHICWLLHSCCLFSAQGWMIVRTSWCLLVPLRLGATNLKRHCGSFSNKAMFPTTIGPFFGGTCSTLIFHDLPNIFLIN